MKIETIKDIAKSKGVANISKLKKKEDIIRAVQLAEGNADCFLRIPDCGIADCAWREDCIG
jgi:hypothetical protein